MLKSVVVCFSMIVLLVSGCAEGPLWRAGHFSPWANQQWDSEEKIAETLFARKARLRESVDAAVKEGTTEQTVEKLANVVRNDPIQLMRIEATRLLPRLSSPAAARALEIAAVDPSADVRLAAVRGLQIVADPGSVDSLSRIVKADANLDVRIAAAKALGVYQDESAVRGLQAALTDLNPAIQVSAIDSLENITGKALGNDVKAWQDYIASSIGEIPQTASESSNSQFR